MIRYVCSGLLRWKPEWTDTSIFLQRQNDILHSFQFFWSFCSLNIFMISKSFKGSQGNNETKKILKKCRWHPSLHLLSIYTKRLKSLSVKLVFARNSSYSFKQKQPPSTFWLTVLGKKMMKPDSETQVWTWWDVWKIRRMPFFFFFVLFLIKEVESLCILWPRTFPTVSNHAYSAHSCQWKKEVS